MITVQHIHRALKDAGLSCALRFPETVDRKGPIPGYRITRKDTGWEIAALNARGKQIPADPVYFEAIRNAGMTVRAFKGTVRIPVKMKEA